MQDGIDWVGVERGLVLDGLEELVRELAEELQVVCRAEDQFCDSIKSAPRHTEVRTERTVHVVDAI